MIARGTGVGTTELQLINGYYNNKNAITNGPAAGFGLYLGTIATNASSTLDYIFGSAASGGSAASLMIWNQFNRVITQTQVTDNGIAYTYTAQTLRQARASAGNQINFVCGLAIDGILVAYSGNITTVAVAGAFGTIALGLDQSSPAITGTSFKVFTAAAIAYVGAGGTMATLAPQLGQHFIMAIERSDNTNANTFDVNGTNVLQMLFRN